MTAKRIAGPTHLWQVLAALAARQTARKLGQVLLAAILGVGSTWFTMAYIEQQQVAQEMEQVFTAEPAAVESIVPTPDAALVSQPQREKSRLEHALIDSDRNARVYLIRYTCGHHGFYSPDPAECRDYRDVIRQVEYLNTQPCPDCAKAAKGS